MRSSNVVTLRVWRITWRVTKGQGNSTCWIRMWSESDWSVLVWSVVSETEEIEDSLMRCLLNEKSEKWFLIKNDVVNRVKGR